MQRLIFPFLLLFSFPLFSQPAAHGTAVNLPLVGRVTGSGNTLFLTSVDVSNNTAASRQVDFYFDGVSGGLAVRVDGSVTRTGLVEQGTGTPLPARATFHSEDFIDSLVQAGMLPAATRDQGVTGSLLLVFDQTQRAGEGSASARFWNSFGGGTVGVSIAGVDVTADGPQSLVTVVRDTRGQPGSQLYTNLFLNNTGLDRSGAPGGFVSLELTAYASSTGAQAGVPLVIRDLAPGHTATVSQVVTQMQLSAGETYLVYARVTSGQSTIAGLASIVDATTRDGSAVLMSRAD